MSGTSVVSLTDYTPAPRYDGVAWTGAKIEEAPAASGPWTLLTTATLSPVDSDPTAPAERSFTVTNASAASGFWYRVTFVDGSGNVGEASAPVYNGDPNLLASVEELEARLGIELTAAEEARAVTLLGTVSDLIRAQVRQTITKVEGDVLTIPGVWGDRIRLPERPVINVQSVTAQFYNGQSYDLPPDSWYVDKDELVRYAFPIGLTRHFFTTGNGWLGPGYRITITYDHGYDPDESPAPRQLAVAKWVALEAVTRAWVNPTGATQTAIGGVQEQYLNGTGIGLTDEEEQDLYDAFRRKTSTVGLR